jgi:hypothetical protein
VETESVSCPPSPSSSYLMAHAALVSNQPETRRKAGSCTWPPFPSAALSAALTRTKGPLSRPDRPELGD